MMRFFKLQLCFALMATFALGADPYNATPPKKAVNMRPVAVLSDSITPSFNTSARVRTTGIDFFVEGSFIWWHVSQEYMDVARSASFVANAASSPAPFARVAVHKFEYQPGFQAAIGYASDFDNWVLKTTYTRIHEETTSTVGSVPASVTAGSEIWILNEWFVNLSTTTQQEMSQVSSTWDLDFDMLDLTLARPIYQGRRLTMSPYVGLRSLWLDQNFNIEGVNANNLTAAPTTSTNESDAWSLGIVAGSSMNWFLGEGFNIDFDLDMSLLYMKYSDLNHNEDVQQSVTTQFPLSGAYPKNGSLRPTLKTGAGFSWGSYLDENNYYLDFALKYDLMILPYQNMMRGTVGYLANNAVGYSNPLGSLFLHGLTVKARFDF